MVVYPAFLLVECVCTYNGDLPNYKVAINLNNIVKIEQIDMSDGQPPRAHIHLNSDSFYVTSCSFDELMQKWGSYFAAPKIPSSTQEEPKPITELVKKTIDFFKALKKAKSNHLKSTKKGTRA
ncbi:hypothetical protein [Runella limosa]|uniref:hypothetical protein n=1 Tax=Runella limosa TaxID=370978 RepID=UPI000490B423|nr:hypothetical protein [Runella limosa]